MPSRVPLLQLTKIQNIQETVKDVGGVDLLVAIIALIYLLIDHFWKIDIPDSILAMSMVVAASIRSQIKRRKRLNKKKRRTKNEVPTESDGRQL